MAKTFPVLECLNCGFSWRCYRAKRKLKPSRNCPKCFARLKVEGEEYKWLDYGNLAHNVSVQQAVREIPRLIQHSRIVPPKKKQSYSRLTDEERKLIRM